jgi:Predicted membrane protein (DUF2231)
MHREQIMRSEFPNPRSIASIGGHPIHPMVVAFPIFCFVGAFVTDLVYWRSMSFIWAIFSVWLITAGLIMAVFAAIVGLIDFAANRRIREFRPAWYHLRKRARHRAFYHQRLRAQPRWLHRGGADGSHFVGRGRPHFDGHGLDGLGDGLSRPCRSGSADARLNQFSVAAAPVRAVCALCDRCVAWSDRNEETFDVRTQIGSNPVLPAPQQYLIPPMKIAKTTEWGAETPTVPIGLQVHALATDFSHPRSIYVLPNGDVRRNEWSERARQPAKGSRHGMGSGACRRARRRRQ